MKKRAPLLLVGLIALLAATPAFAVQSRVLRGSIEPSGRVKVSISYFRHEGHRFRAYEVEFRDIPLTCRGGATATVDIENTRQVIRNNAVGAHRFGLGVGGASARRFEYGWLFRGRLIAPREARGSVRYHSDSVPVSGGGRDFCHSGVLRWAAVG